MSNAWSNSSHASSPKAVFLVPSQGNVRRGGAHDMPTCENGVPPSQLHCSKAGACKPLQAAAATLAALKAQRSVTRLRAAPANGRCAQFPQQIRVHWHVHISSRRTNLLLQLPSNWVVWIGGSVEEEPTKHLQPASLCASLRPHGSKAQGHPSRAWCSLHRA